MNRHIFNLVFAALAFTAFVPSSVLAQIVTPAGLQPGDHFNLIFITSGSIDAFSTNPSTYDTFAASQAAAAGLDQYGSQTVTWKALASFPGGPDAIERFDPNSPIYTLNGALVASNGAALWDGTLDNPVDITQFNNLDSGIVWTGTLANGTTGNTFGSVLVGVGDSGLSWSNWIQTGVDNRVIGSGPFIGEDREEPIYVFSSELTVPMVPLPSPAAIAALGLALSFFATILRQPRRSEK